MKIEIGFLTDGTGTVKLVTDEGCTFECESDDIEIEYPDKKSLEGYDLKLKLKEEKY